MILSLAYNASDEYNFSLVIIKKNFGNTANDSSDFTNTSSVTLTQSDYFCSLTGYFTFN
jgi:hypothetical protein